MLADYLENKKISLFPNGLDSTYGILHSVDSGMGEKHCHIRHKSPLAWHGMQDRRAPKPLLKNMQAHVVRPTYAGRPRANTTCGHGPQLWAADTEAVSSPLYALAER